MHRAISQEYIKEGLKDFVDEDQKIVLAKCKQSLSTFSDEEKSTWPKTISYDDLDALKLIAKSNKLTMIKLIDLIIANQLVKNSE